MFIILDIGLPEYRLNLYRIRQSDIEVQSDIGMIHISD